MHSLLSTILAASGLVAAATWQPFRSDDCSWGGGQVIINQIGQAPSVPIPVGGDHSFRVEDCLMQVILYENDCDHPLGGQINQAYVGWGECYHVNTGHNWGCAVVNCV